MVFDASTRRGDWLIAGREARDCLDVTANPGSGRYQRGDATGLLVLWGAEFCPQMYIGTASDKVIIPRPQ